MGLGFKDLIAPAVTAPISLGQQWGMLGDTRNKQATQLSDPASFLNPVQQLRDAPRGEFEQMLMGQARSTGMSPLRQLNLDQVSAAGQGNLQQGLGNIAASGGLTTGARERLTRQSGRDILKSQQNVFGGNIADKQKMMSNFANLEGRERETDVGALNDRDNLLAQLKAAKELGQAQMNAANQPDMLNRLSLGML